MAASPMRIVTGAGIAKLAQVLQLPVVEARFEYRGALPAVRQVLKPGVEAMLTSGEQLCKTMRQRNGSKLYKHGNRMLYGMHQQYLNTKRHWLMINADFFRNSNQILV